MEKPRDIPPAAASPRRSATTTRTTPATRASYKRGAPRIAGIGARNRLLAPHALSAPLRVCAGGDVTLGTNLDPEWARVASRKLRVQSGHGDSPAELAAPLAPIVADADMLLLNVESAIGAGANPSKCGPTSTSCFAFRAPPSAAGVLRSLAAGKPMVGNIANNHARDAGDEGRDSTIALLTRAGVLVTGADTLATPVPLARGDTIGVLGFYTSDDTPDARDTAAVYRHVARAAARYPVVIATMHLGAEGREAQRSLDREELYLHIDRGNPVAFADAAVRGGAALVIGHGPHVMRAIEWRRGGALIAYSLGNLLTYGPFRLKEPMNRGALLCTTIARSGLVESAELRSTVQRLPGLLELDATHRAAQLVDSLGRLDFPRSAAARRGGSGTLEPSAP